MGEGKSADYEDKTIAEYTANDHFHHIQDLLRLAFPDPLADRMMYAALFTATEDFGWALKRETMVEMAGLACTACLCRREVIIDDDGTRCHNDDNRIGWRIPCRASEIHKKIARLDT